MAALRAPAIDVTAAPRKHKTKQKTTTMTMTWARTEMATATTITTNNTTTTTNSSSSNSSNNNSKNSLQQPRQENLLQQSRHQLGCDSDGNSTSSRFNFRSYSTANSSRFNKLLTATLCALPWTSPYRPAATQSTSSRRWPTGGLSSHVYTYCANVPTCTSSTKTDPPSI